MSPSITALIVYAGWSLLLLITLVSYRSVLTVAGKRAANSFRHTGEGDSEFVQRLVRAHANCYENLPVFAALVLAAAASGNSAVTDGLVWWVVAARVGQSTVHLASTHNVAVIVRFHFFAAQLAILGYWAVLLLRKA